MTVGCVYCLTSYQVTEVVCAEAEGRKERKKNPKCRTTILDIVPPSPAPPLATKPRPSLFDPDRNLVG